MESFDGDSQKKFPQISAYVARLSTFPEIPENPVPFVTGNFQKFKQEFFIESKVLFLVWFEPEDYTHESLIKAITVFMVNLFHLQYNVT